MEYLPIRRKLLLGIMTLPLAESCFAISPKTLLLPSLEQQIAILEKNNRCQIGMTLLTENNNFSLLYRANQRFPLCSSFKVMAAAALLYKSMKALTLMQQEVIITPEKLVAYSPVTTKYINKPIKLSAICAAGLQYSDNTAGNIMIEQLGGIAAVNQFARNLGDNDFRLDRMETALNEAIPGDLRDTTTPFAMAHSLKKLILGTILGNAQRNQLIQWMLGNTTGNHSIRAGVPEGWLVADKTGSGGYGTTNDVAIIWPISKKPIVLTLYLKQFTKDAAARRDLLATVTKQVLTEFMPGIGRSTY